MTVIEDDSNMEKNGAYPIIFKGYKSIEEVYEWLFNHYNGYHFVVIMDVTKDMYEPYGKELRVYFTDTVIDELAYMCDKKIVKT